MSWLLSRLLILDFCRQADSPFGQEQNQVRTGEGVCKAERNCVGEGESVLIKEYSSGDVGDCSLRCYVTKGCNAYVSLWGKKICRLYRKCQRTTECHRSELSL